MSARLAHSEGLRKFNEPYNKNEVKLSTWSNLENLDFYDHFRFSIFHKFMMLEERNKKNKGKPVNDFLTKRETLISPR